MPSNPDLGKPSNLDNSKIDLAPSQKQTTQNSFKISNFNTISHFPALMSEREATIKHKERAIKY